jgi:hypothetical protein
MDIRKENNDEYPGVGITLKAPLGVGFAKLGEFTNGFNWIVVGV